METRTTLWSLLAVCVAVLATGLAGCDRTPREAQAAMPPPPDAVPAMGLAAQAPDTMRVVATWGPVTWRGDTISSYARTIERTDTAQALGGLGTNPDTVIEQVGSEMFTLPGPGEGETGTYRYCLRSVRPDGGVPPDSAQYRTCATWQYTQPVEYPPPPDSVEVSPEQTLAYDSMQIWPRAIWMRPLALRDSFPWPQQAGQGIEVAWNEMSFRVLMPDNTWADSTAEILTAFATPDGGKIVVDTFPRAEYPGPSYALYRNGAVVACDGHCDTVMVQPAMWERNLPVAFRGRGGGDEMRRIGPAVNEVRLEWMAYRLPWLRQLDREVYGRS